MNAVILEEQTAAGITVVNGKNYMTDGRGALVPVETIAAADKLEDEVVRKIMGFAETLSAEVSRFLGHTKTDLGEFDALLEQDHNVKRGGKKGNRTYMTFDALMKVQVAVSDTVTFSARLQVAKKILDDLMNEWAADSRPEIRAIITRAFNTEKEGEVSISEIYRLLRLDIADPTWQEAMRAIREAIRVVGSKEYVRFYRREAVTDEFQAVTIDLAKA